MRNLTPQSGSNATARRGSNAGIGANLASPAQARYKGLISTPGVTKFSAWKREQEIPRTLFHEYILQKIAEKPSDRVWIKDVSSGRCENFGSVQHYVTKISSGLTKLGYKNGDVICMFCSNYVEYWLIALAAWSCGGCVMPVNCELEKEPLENQLETAGAKIIVCDELNMADALSSLEKVRTLSKVVVVGSAPDGVENCLSSASLMSDDGGKFAPKKPDINWENQTVYLPFTSTSSGSQGIEHTHKTLLSQFFSPDNAANHWFDQIIGETVLCGNWFFHMTGLYSFALSAIYGISMYVLSDYSNASLLKAIQDNKLPNATLYPWQIRLLSQSPEVTRYDLGCLKTIVTGGSHLSATIRSEAMDRFPSLRFIREAYGLNECGLCTLSYPREKKNSVPGGMKAVDLPNDHKIPIGLPNMYTQIKIVDRQTSEAVQGPDEQGEICVKSPQTFKGYLGSSSDILDSDGFFHTGDLGYYDAQGVVYFIECIDRLIHFWMYEVAPSILEARLLGSNNIVDAAVVGIPDRENGQVPRAFVVLKAGFEETEENLTNLMESRLEDHERIRGGLYFIQSIPRDENWKVRRDLLAEYQPKKVGEHVEATGKSEPAETGNKDKLAPQDLAKQVAESPQLARKIVLELPRQPNGAFVAVTPPDIEEAGSPRTKRTGTLSGQQDATARARSRRGSMDITMDDRGGLGLLNLSSMAIIQSASSSRRGSASQSDALSDITTPYTFSYWLRVTIVPEVIEKVIASHPSVRDVVVVAHHESGVGDLPRAFVELKKGYSTTEADLLQFVNSRVVSTDQLRGGVAIVDKIPRDPNGQPMINLEKMHKNVVGMDDGMLKSQPKLVLRL